MAEGDFWGISNLFGIKIKGAEVVIVVVPAYGQGVYTDYLVEYAEKGQIVFFSPGKFGVLAFAKKMTEAGRRDDVFIGETLTLLYAAKGRKLGHLRIKAVKKTLTFAALPAKLTPVLLEKLNNLFTQLSPGLNVIQISLDDPGTVVHPITTLMNTSRIEQRGPFRNAHYDITPSVGRVIDEVDKERVSIASALKIPAMSLVEACNELYGSPGKNTCEAMQGISAHNIQSFI